MLSKRRRAESAMRAEITMQIIRDVVCITDHDGPVSVTNDAEQVIAWLDDHGTLRARPVIYRDTMGNWDELRHRHGRFQGFVSCGGTRDRDTAIRIVKERARD